MQCIALLSTLAFILTLVHNSEQLECYDCMADRNNAKGVPAVLNTYGNFRSCNNLDNSLVVRCASGQNACIKKVISSSGMVIRSCGHSSECDFMEHNPNGNMRCYRCFDNKCNTSSTTALASTALFLSLILSVIYLYT